MSSRTLALFLVLPALLLTIRPVASKPEGDGRRLTRVGDLRFHGGSNFRLTRGDFGSASADELVLSMTGANGIPAVLIYRHHERNRLVRVGDLRFDGAAQVWTAAGNLFSDARDELVVALTYPDGRRSVQVYEIPGDHRVRRILDLGFTGGSDYHVSTGNFDGDSLDEFVLTMRGADGRLASIIYDIQGVGRASRIGDLRFFGGSWIRAVAANLDNDPIDELVLAFDQPGNKRSMAAYDHPVNGRQPRIAQVEFKGGTDFQLTAANLDWDDHDEVILGMRGGDGRWAVLVHDTGTGRSLERTGDLRFHGGSDLGIATANIDHDPAEEILLTQIDGQGDVALMTYDALTSRHLRRLETLRMTKGSHPGVASARLVDGKTDQILLTLLGTDGRRAVLAYDYRADISETIGTVPLLTILWDPHRPNHPAPARRDVEQILFENPDFSVAGWFDENSGGKLRLTNAGIFGWLDADEPWQFYWREGDYAPPTNPNHPNYHREDDGTLMYLDDNGFTGGIAAGWAEAIHKIDPQVNFRHFDGDGDGVVQSDELAILIVKPQNNTRGFQRTLLGRMVPKWEPLVMDGVELTDVAEVYTGGNLNQRGRLGTFVEELAHATLGIPDQYFEGPLAGGTFGYVIWNDAGGFSLTTANDRHVHLEPFQKWRLGWTEPTPVSRSGSYTIRHAGGRSETLLLSHPGRGSREYFLLENRWQDPNSYDQLMADQGLAVWHVMEDPEIYGRLSSPAGIRPGRWELFGRGDWGRRAIRLLRPDERIPFTPALLPVDWDGDARKEVLVLPREDEIQSPLLVYDFGNDRGRLDRLDEPWFRGGRGLTATVAALDADAPEEIVMALEGTDGRLAVLAYESLGGTRTRRFGDLRLPGERQPALAAANIDRDPESEILLARVSANGNVLLSIYEPPAGGRMTEVNRIDLGPGSLPMVATGDLNGDGGADLVVGWQRPNDEWRVAAYRLDNSGVVRITELSFRGVSELQACMADLDATAGAELILGMRDGMGRMTLLPHALDETGRLIRVGDLRFPNHMELALATGNLDADAARELAISSLAADGTLHFQLYDLRRRNDLRLLGSMTFTGGFDADVAWADLDGSGPEDLIVTFRGTDERLAVLTYDLNDPSRLAQHRRGDARWGRNDSTSLWDGSDPATGYDLLSRNPDPSRAELRWADGTPSGFAIRNISGPGPQIRIDIEVP